jgi:hypothetical protein
MKWIDISEIVTGKVLDKKILVGDVPVNHLASPFLEIVEGLKGGKSESDLAAETYATYMVSAKQASARVKDEDWNWLEMLSNSFLYEEVGAMISAEAKKMEQGQPPSLTTLQMGMDRLLDGELRGDEFVSMYDLTEESYSLIPSGFRPIDEHNGGIPESALTVVGGLPGSGKTFFLLQLLVSRLGLERSEIGMFITLEMTRSQIKERALEAITTPVHVQKRMLLEDRNFSVEEAVTAIARAKRQYPALKFVALDYVDYLPKRETNPTIMEHIYRSLATCAKEQEISLLLAAQLNRQYTSGAPMVNDLRWTAIAEAMSASILFTHNPNRTMNRGRDGSRWEPPVFDDSAYVVIGKSKFNTPHDGLGAIRIKWNEKEFIWSPETNGDMWYPYGGMSND